MWIYRETNQLRRTRANKDLNKKRGRKRKKKEEKENGEESTPRNDGEGLWSSVKNEACSACGPADLFPYLSRWTRPSSSVEGHKFHRWNFRTSPFIWFSRKKWSGRCSPDPCLHPSHPSSSPPPPIATLEHPETGVTAKFQILVPFSRVFNTRGGVGHPLLVKSSSRIRMWEMVGNFVSTFQLRWRRK